MTPTPSSAPPVQHRAAARPGAPPRHRRARAPHRRSADREERLLGRYTDPRRRAREVIARRGAGGTVLVVDRDRATHGDRRLVAHLAADEPADNAALVCSRYLQDATAARCRCRLLTAEDARSTPFGEGPHAEADAGPDRGDAPPVDRGGCRYLLELVPSGGMSIPELRWCRRHPGPEPDGGQRVSVREVVACIESYEPVCELTIRALALEGRAGEVSTTVLRAELTRVQESPIVLNRRLLELRQGAHACPDAVPKRVSLLSDGQQPSCVPQTRIAVVCKHSDDRVAQIAVGGARMSASDGSI